MRCSSSRLPRSREPLARGTEHRFSDLLHGYLLECLGEKGLDQQTPGGIFRQPAGAQVEEGVAIELTGSGAMTALDLVREDSEFGLLINLGRIRQQQCLAQLMAVRLPGLAMHDNASLEHTARRVVENPLEGLPTGRARGTVLDPGRVVADLLVPAQIGAGEHASAA